MNGHELVPSNASLVRRHCAEPVVHEEAAEPERRDASKVDDAVELAVRRINRLHRAAALQLALDMGSVIVETVFEGDMDRVRVRGTKDYSFRKLAAHPDVPCSRATLWRAVAVYELVRRHPELVRRQHLTLAHIRGVLGLPADLQLSLLVQADELRQPSRWVEAQVARWRDRPPNASVNRAEVGPRIQRDGAWLARVRKLHGGLQSLGVPATSGPELVEGRTDLHRLVRELRRWCDQVEGLMSASDDAEPSKFED